MYMFACMSIDWLYMYLSTYLIMYISVSLQ